MANEAYSTVTVSEPFVVQETSSRHQRKLREFPAAGWLEFAVMYIVVTQENAWILTRNCRNRTIFQNFLGHQVHHSSQYECSDSFGG